MNRPALIQAEPSISGQRYTAPDHRLTAFHLDVRRTVILAVLFAFPACLAISSLAFGQNNPDLWWHLRTGAWIVQHRGVPWTDPYSSFGIGRPWLAYSWLYELVLYGSYRWLGLLGPALFVVLLAGINGAVLYRAIRNRAGGFAAAVGLTAVGTLALAPFYTAMPVLVSILCFLVEVDLLFGELVGPQGRPSSRSLWLMPVLFAFWANVHVEFIYGLVVLLLAAVLQDRRLTIGAGGARLKSTAPEYEWRLWAVLAASSLATLANPYGWRLYRVIWSLAVDRTPFKVVSELNAPTFRSPLDYILLFTVIAAGFFLGRSRTRGALFEGALLAGCAIVSLRAAHDTWVVLIVALLVIAEASGPARRANPVASPKMELIAGVLALLLAAGWTAREGLTDRRLQQLASQDFPAQASDFVLRHQLPGPLFNGFNWGGYLIWKLPNLPVAMDGRTNVYGGARTERNIATWTCQPGWKNDPDLNAANLVIGSVKAPLSYALQSDSQFQLVYQDATSMVFVRRSQRPAARNQKQ